MRTVLEQLCDMNQFNKGNPLSKASGIRLRRFILSKEEWDIIKQMHRLLSVCRLPHLAMQTH